jgi:hypothetical protein
MTEYVETQLTLTAWGVETFGPVQPLRLLIRGKEELVEAMRELSLHPDPIGFTGASAAAEECADTAIILFRAAHMFRAPGQRSNRCVACRRPIFSSLERSGNWPMALIRFSTERNWPATSRAVIGG